MDTYSKILFLIAIIAAAYSFGVWKNSQWAGLFVFSLEAIGLAILSNFIDFS